MIWVNIGDQNKVGFGSVAELRRFCGIEINCLSACFDQRAGVIERSNLDRAR